MNLATDSTNVMLRFALWMNTCPSGAGIAMRGCAGLANHGNRSWVRKQKSIVSATDTKSWLNRPVTYQELFDASRPRKISDAQKKRLVEMGWDIATEWVD
jgi:hypothetical protein